MDDRLRFRSIVYFLKLTLCICLLLPGCQGKRKSNAPYKHLSLNTNEEILVDKIVTLETRHKSNKDKSASVDKVVKIGIENVPSKASQNKFDPNRDDDIDLVETTDLEEIKGQENDLILLTLIEELRTELKEVKISQEYDRQKMSSLENQLKGQQEDLVLSRAESIQMRQLVTENYDNIVTLNDITHDNSILVEGLQLFKKDADKEIRRFGEYKERAAKRFHQLTNLGEKNEKNIATVTNDVSKFYQSIDNLTEVMDSIGQNGASLRENVLDLHFKLSELNETLENVTSCCLLHSNSKLTNQNTEYSLANQFEDSLTNQVPGISNKHDSKIEIVEFGSGDFKDEIWSRYEEQSNVIENSNTNDISENMENIEDGSGEVIHEGSGELGSGEIDQLPPFLKIDLSSYVEKSEFEKENAKLKEMLDMYLTRYENMSAQVTQMDSRITSIQLGNFMQNLQESLINFTQNVITLDQWKTSSTHIVNSTLTNHDEINKLTNMVIDNTDKMADMHWKVSNAEILSNQQFNILKMYIIRLNNSMEDMKEHISELEKKQSKVLQAGNQPGGFYGYQSGFNAGYQSTGSKENRSHTDHHEDKFITLMSRLDELGLQIVFNQNRLGNLEVKMLNDSLHTCRKYNMDTYQDSQLASHESIIKSNTNSILLTHTYVKELDRSLQALNSEMKSNGRRIRNANSNMQTLQQIIPAVVMLKKEVEHFKLQLPIDCSEYHERGYRKSGAYVIHPITARHSSQVTCHMTEDGGWTVIQQRFNGSVNFNRNWTDYAIGFGSVDSEHWLGNYLTYILTSTHNYSLEIEMVDFYNETWIASYDSFSVTNPRDEFRITVDGYHGNATDGMAYSQNMAFSTINNDNDASSMNCAFYYEAGWWYKHCQTCNLNGRYNIGFVWFNLNTSDYIRLVSSVMRIRRND